MGLIKYFFCINSRGNPIVIRAFLTEPVHSVVETFYAKIASTNPPPAVFRCDNMNFAYICEAQLYFVIVTEESMSPSLLLELLSRIVSVISDYAGRCTELIMQQNLGLVYEIVDEVLSFGCPQATDSSNLLHLVHNTVKYDKGLNLGGVVLLGPFDNQDFDRPLALSVDQRSLSTNEVFFILDERIEAQLTVDNNIIRSTITGVGTIKSFLQGQPSILIQFDPQMTVATRSIPQNLLLKYDDIVFAPFVQSQSFDSDRSISFAPPEGTSNIFRYRTTRSFQTPFTITPVFENKQTKAVVLRLSIRSHYDPDDIPPEVKVVFQCPVEISNASCELPPVVESTQSSEYNPKTRQVTWTIQKFPGLQEFSGRFRFIFDNGIPCAAENILGPISLQFSRTGKLPSGLTIKNYVVSTSGSSTPPKRWIKEISTATCMTFNFI
ncbi:Adaptor complexes medium subunit family protein [Histomonas meleagridis]|uniref:Adaptor complexes medium subunit family protein n=1 Tax=Histomonas meleagridis TaxID=135588 RepID=UPI00355A4D81|nr:Adaptor complexes medium subunit family protein [Histomonas meleagridis]KAH0800675.1 Adaptor complexes medium subunit family protein [Histomonas meleagridis]